MKSRLNQTISAQLQEVGWSDSSAIILPSASEPVMGTPTFIAALSVANVLKDAYDAGRAACS